jgi:TldD protein
MLDGPHHPDEIIASVNKGIYAETFTNGQVNIGSGDFSFYLKNGFLIEDGKLARPVKDANLIGFGPDVLEKVEMVGNDMAMYSGAGYCGKDGQRVPVGFGLPTTKCGGISVGGVE